MMDVFLLTRIVGGIDSPLFHIREELVDAVVMGSLPASRNGTSAAVLSENLPRRNLVLQKQLVSRSWRTMLTE